MVPRHAPHRLALSEARGTTRHKRALARAAALLACLLVAAAAQPAVPVGR
jgi:hypothetical protein